MTRDTTSCRLALPVRNFGANTNANTASDGTHTPKNLIQCWFRSSGTHSNGCLRSRQLVCANTMTLELGVSRRQIIISQELTASAAAQPAARLVAAAPREWLLPTCFQQQQLSSGRTRPFRILAAV